MTTKSSIRVKPHTVGQAARQRHQCRADRTRPKLSDSGQEACRLEQEREGRVRRALGHGFMCRAYNLIAVPCHAPAMPVCPTRAPVNPAFKIRIHDLKGTSQPIRPPRKRPPPNPNGFTHLLAQVALDPLPAQNHCQEYKHCDDARNKREIAPRDKILCGHATWPNDPATAATRRGDGNSDAMPPLAGAWLAKSFLPLLTEILAEHLIKWLNFLRAQRMTCCLRKQCPEALDSLDDRRRDDFRTLKLPM